MGGGVGGGGGGRWGRGGVFSWKYKLWQITILRHVSLLSSKTLKKIVLEKNIQSYPQFHFYVSQCQ